MYLKVKDIIIKDRLRPADPDKVQELAESIKLIGLLQPIVVNQNNGLVAGLHRLEAYKSLGKDEIKCELIEGDTLKEELAELDENLVRSDFHYIDRGMYLMRKKEIYDALNANGSTSSYADSEIKVKPFTQVVAEKTKQSVRTVQNEIKVAKDIIPELKDQIKGNKIGFVEAVKMSRLDAEAQKQISEKIKSGDFQPPKKNAGNSVQQPVLEKSEPNISQGDKNPQWVVSEIISSVQAIQGKLKPHLDHLSAEQVNELAKCISKFLTEIQSSIHNANN